jgi:hypothetical protein
MGIFNRRQVSTIERIAAMRGPASWLPKWIQFLRPNATGRMAFSAALVLNSRIGCIRLTKHAADIALARDELATSPGACCLRASLQFPLT